MRVAVILTGMFLAGCSASPDAPAAAPSVLVATVRPQRGAQPDWLAAYGSAGPATNGSVTLSVPQAGQVTQLTTTPGAAVRAGQALVTFATAPAAVSGYQQAQSAVAAARKQRDTTAQLLTQQLATKDQVTQAEKALSDAEQSLAAQQRDGAGQAVRVLRAPFDGVVMTVSVAQGDRPAAGAALVTVARAGGIIATVGIDPEAAAGVHVGQEARLARLTGGVALPAHVIRVDKVLNPKTRQIDVDLSIPGGAFVPNEALKAEIATRQVSGWVVPHVSVVTANGAPHVFQIAGGKAKAVPVSLLLPGTQADVVDGAIDPNKPLIVAGAYQVSDGDAVRTGAAK